MRERELFRSLLSNPLHGHSSLLTPECDVSPSVPRLGLLAVLDGAGDISIFAVPHPRAVKRMMRVNDGADQKKRLHH